MAAPPKSRSKRSSKSSGKSGATGPKRRERTPWATQGTIPGTQPKKDKTLTQLAGKYRFSRDERMAVQRDEIADKAKLIDYMKNKGIERHEDPGADLLVELQPGKDNVKVSSLDKPPED